MNMERKPLGSTGLWVSPIGLGLAALGRPGYINLGHAEDLRGKLGVEAMAQRAHEMLDIAWRNGVRYVDAARSYGRAEQFLGAWLKARHIAPDEIVVGSKWGYTYTAGWQVDAAVHEIKDQSVAVLERQWLESLGPLGDHLDLYQIHSATLESGVLEDHAVLEALAQRKATGVHIGLSLSGPGQAEALARALEIHMHGTRLFDTVQATWNLLEPSIGPSLAAAREAGLGVIVKEALANGRLTDRNTDPDFAARLALLRREVGRVETTVDALALAAVLAQPWADVVLSGAAVPEHLLSNLRAIEISPDLAMATALESLAEPPEQYWQTRSRLRWN